MLSASSKSFVPRHFPPLGLRRKQFIGALRKANRTLQYCASILADVPSSILFQLICLESIDSLEPQLKTIECEKIAGELILKHTEALNWACKNIAHTAISNTLLCQLHKKAKGSKLKANLGSYPKKQNWIGPVGCTIDEAYFYPPSPQQVVPLMKELIAYCRVKKKEPLLQLALIFAQFLIIHPFMDGNGRIARMLIPLFLRKHHLIPHPFFFMSNYFKKHRLCYFQNLYQTTEGDRWENWIIFFLKGVNNQANKLSKLLMKTRKLYEEMQTQVDVKVLHFLFHTPIFSMRAFKQTAGTKQLEILLKNKWLRKTKNRFTFIPFVKILKNYQK